MIQYLTIYISVAFHAKLLLSVYFLHQHFCTSQTQILHVLAWRHPHRAADQWPWSEHFGSQSYFQFNSKEQHLPDDFVLGLDLKLFDKQFAELIRAEQLC